MFSNSVGKGREGGAWRGQRSDEGCRKRGDERGSSREESSKEMTRGTHVTAVYPALFLDVGN